MKFELMIVWVGCVVGVVSAINFTTNYNSSKVDDVSSGDPISLPIILTSIGEHKSNTPLT